jgi:hypothetical protein
MSWSNNNNKTNSRIMSEPNSLNDSTISYKSSISNNSTLTSSSHHLPPLSSSSTSSISRPNSTSKNTSKLNIGSEDILKKLEVSS